MLMDLIARVVGHFSCCVNRCQLPLEARSSVDVDRQVSLGPRGFHLVAVARQQRRILTESGQRTKPRDIATEQAVPSEVWSPNQELSHWSVSQCGHHLLRTAEARSIGLDSAGTKDALSVGLGAHRSSPCPTGDSPKGRRFHHLLSLRRFESSPRERVSAFVGVSTLQGRSCGDAPPGGRTSRD
jgi:hypothetical protein